MCVYVGVEYVSGGMEFGGGWDIGVDIGLIARLGIGRWTVLLGRGAM